jgi:predicted nuclease with RNAse H fold
VTVCGIDVGSLRTPSAVAWLHGSELSFGAYVPSASRPLPEPPPDLVPACFAIDAPQGLPVAGEPRRLADRLANTPTRVLASRREDAAAGAFGALVEAGLTIFWEALERGLASLERENALPTIVETYPHFVIRTIGPDLRIPSKRREPRRYVGEVWAGIGGLGYRAAAPPATHDEVDAALCALAAQAWNRGAAVEVGLAPVVDVPARVLREGFIVAPA